MKISLALLGLASAGDFMSKEWEVAEAYYNDKPIVLQDPDDERSRNKQWHDCGDKPATPNNGRDVVCNGKWCAAVCNQGKLRKTLNSTLEETTNLEQIIYDS